MSRLESAQGSVLPPKCTPVPPVDPPRFSLARVTFFGMANNDKAGKRTRKPRRPFGEIETRASGRIRARYKGPDTLKHSRMFSHSGDAEVWLGQERILIERGEWTPPEVRAAVVHLTVNDYATRQLKARELAPLTRRDYDRYLERFVTNDALGAMPIRSVTPADVETWLAAVRSATGKTMAARVYSFVASIFRAAVANDVIPACPFRVKNAGKAKRQRPKTMATAQEVAAVLPHLPKRYRALVLVAAWGGLRSGELRNLRRRDVDLKKAVVHVREQVQNVPGQGKVVRELKTEAAHRDVDLPTHVVAMLREQIKARSQSGDWGRDGLVFPSRRGTPISQSVLWRTWNKARRAIGRPDLRFHDLRHTAADLAAHTGATVAELMARLGHATPNAAMDYQQAAAGAGKRIAAGLDAAAREAAAAPLEDAS